jgi:hypothetical protein
MPLFMDVHQTLPEGATFDDVKGAHEADLKTQERYSVAYLRYWVDESQGKVFCLVDAPKAEAATTVHREAHGLVADDLRRTGRGVAEMDFMRTHPIVRSTDMAALVVALGLMLLVWGQPSAAGHPGRRDV